MDRKTSCYMLAFSVTAFVIISIEWWERLAIESNFADSKNNIPNKNGPICHLFLKTSHASDLVHDCKDVKFRSWSQLCCNRNVEKTKRRKIPLLPVNTGGVTHGKSNITVKIKVEDDEYNDFSMDGLVETYLDRASATGWESLDKFSNGIFTVDVKLPIGYSAGVVTTFFMTSPVTKDKIGNFLGNDAHDEIDWEFLGHSSPDKILLHTNYFAKGVGAHEEQFTLWFNPSSDFHTYTIIWNKFHILWIIDGIPLREVRASTPDKSVTKPMRLHGTIWDGSQWATEHGKLRANYTLAPFSTFYRNFNFTQTCAHAKPKPLCAYSNTKNDWDFDMNEEQRRVMKEYRTKHLIYTWKGKPQDHF